jgi:hypothetical protein
MSDAPQYGMMPAFADDVYSLEPILSTTGLNRSSLDASPKAGDRTSK